MVPHPAFRPTISKTRPGKARKSKGRQLATFRLRACPSITCHNTARVIFHRISAPSRFTLALLRVRPAPPSQVPWAKKSQKYLSTTWPRAGIYNVDGEASENGGVGRQAGAKLAARIARSAWRAVGWGKCCQLATNCFTRLGPAVSRLQFATGRAGWRAGTVAA